ncbi:Hypothetical protein NocV09_03700350 [Nannochloropsis oceanica]
MGLFDDKGRLLQITWYACMATSIAYVISALVVASRLSKSETPSATDPHAFAAIWSMILLVCILVGGTVVFKRIQTPIATGVLLGCTAMFSQIQLLLFTIFEARSRQAESASEKSADGAIATFAFFLFLIFGIFSLFLFMWRQYLPTSSSQSSMDSYA